MDFDGIDRLARLRDSGALSEEEFQREKSRLLANNVLPAPQEKPRFGVAAMLAVVAALLALAAKGRRVPASNRHRLI